MRPRHSISQSRLNGCPLTVKPSDTGPHPHYTPNQNLNQVNVKEHL